MTVTLRLEFLGSYDTEAEAKRARDEFAALLREQGNAGRYQVGVRPTPRGFWVVELHETRRGNNG